MIGKETFCGGGQKYYQIISMKFGDKDEGNVIRLNNRPAPIVVSLDCTNLKCDKELIK